MGKIELKWRNIEGLSIHPYFNKKQKIRTRTQPNYLHWEIDLDDPTTLGYFILQLIEEGFEIKKTRGKFYLDNKEINIREFISTHLEK